MAERASATLYKGESFVANNRHSSSQEYKPVEWAIPEEFQGIINYNPRHDIQDFLDLANLQGKIPPEEFAQRQIQTINRTRRQLEKMLGERFRVRSSQVEYFVEAGKLKSPDYPEPVIERYEEGRRFLVESGSAETEREQTEVDCMRQLEKIFSEGELREDEKVLIVSAKGPKGSLYNDNYFDVYEQKGDKIIMTRYLSTHSYEGFSRAAQVANSYLNWQEPEKLDAAYFFKRPIVTTLSTDRILEIFAVDPATQPEKINQEIKKDCEPYTAHYIRMLIENPSDIEEIKKALNTIFNVSDETELKTRPSTWVEAKTIPYPQFASIEQAVNFYGSQPVRIVSNGCPGGQSGFSLNQPSFLKSLGLSIGAMSTVDFAEISNSNAGEKTLNCKCPFCGMRVEAKISSGKISCPKCHNSAPYEC